MGIFNILFEKDLFFLNHLALKKLSYDCFCGNSYGKYLQAMDLICNDPTNGDCNCLTACSGDKNSFCGDLFANSVYLSASSSCESIFVVEWRARIYYSFLSVLYRLNY
jgi:hypothetical protein